MLTKLLFLICIVLTSSIIAMDPQKYNSSLYPDYSNIIAKKKGRGIKNIGIERCLINECLLENRNVDVVVDTEGNEESRLYIDKVKTENESGKKSEDWFLDLRLIEARASEKKRRELEYKQDASAAREKQLKQENEELQKTIQKTFWQRHPYTFGIGFLTGGLLCGLCAYYNHTKIDSFIAGVISFFRNENS